jgi:hypothetical protein
MLCLGNMEKAAELVIDRLQDDDEREAAIRSFAEPTDSSNLPPFLAKILQRATKVRARPEVIKEFDEVGRALKINGSASFWGSY